MTNQARGSCDLPGAPDRGGHPTAAAWNLPAGAGRLGARIASAAAGVAIAATAWAGLASNALLPTERPRFDVVRRFAEPMLSRCDVVLHNVFAVSNDVVQIGSLDTRIGSGRGGCTEYVHEKDWPVSALDPRCDFSDPSSSSRFGGRDRGRRESFRPKRIGYLLTAAPESRAHVELLRRLYPSALVKKLPGETPEESLFAMEVPFSEIAALRSPEKSSPPGGARATIEGGLLLTERDWYRFRLDPECPGAELAAGTPPSSSAQPRPHLAGVHPFAVRRHDAARPLTARAESALARDRRDLTPCSPPRPACHLGRASGGPGLGDLVSLCPLWGRWTSARMRVVTGLALGPVAGLSTVSRILKGRRRPPEEAPPAGTRRSRWTPGNCLIRVGPAIEIQD